MTKQEQIEHTHQQVRNGLVLAFKRYEKTPVIISRTGQVVAVSPDDMPPVTTSID